MLDTGDLPPSTVISFHTGSIRRHAQIEKGKAINLSYVSGSEPVRVDLMSLIGTHRFDMVPGQDVYDVPIAAPAQGADAGSDVRLKFQIRDTSVARGQEDAAASGRQDAPSGGDGGDFDSQSPVSPSKKLQTALMMRSYLDNHDVLRQMQMLLQDMVTHRPDNPLEYMTQRLEDVVRDGQGMGFVGGDIVGTIVGDELPSAQTADQSGDAAGAPGEGDAAKDNASDQGSECGEDEAGFVERKPQAAGRREGVSAEAMRGDDDNWQPPVYEKTPEEREQLSTIIKTSHDSKLHMLFGTVAKETFEQIVDAMQIRAVKQGENVIEQGGVGDYFYIVKSGWFDIFINKGGEMIKVFETGVGFAFGEMALLYNAPRSATITAAQESAVWCLDRAAFRNLVVRSAEQLFKQNVAFLSNIAILQELSQAERAALAEVLETEEFDDDEAIVEQDETDDKMFIVRSGKAVACIKGAQGEVEVKQYGEGDYFGEIALLSGVPRKASVYAVGACVCLYITRATFMRILGPLKHLLERNMGAYGNYADAIQSSDVAEDNCEQTGAKKPKAANRKRERKTEDLGAAIKEKAVAKETVDEPASLADKVAVDFKNPALVEPCADFVVEEAKFAMFGGLLLGQKFCMNKRIHTRTQIPRTPSGDGETYKWQGPTKIKGVTDVFVSCQKGQKSASDPTPNQDNYFICHQDNVAMYGVADGHGPFGHLVSFRLVQTLPKFIAKSQHFPKDMEATLKEAFLAAQQDLCDFCGQHDINIEASGAAGSVMILVDQSVHIAFIGDARIMLGSWNRRDSRMIFVTQDHKPELPEERARLEAAGSEVREVDPDAYRIYIKGSNFPGLTMSRAFGDTACEGILREPEYHHFMMQPTDQWYAVVASDGIWEFISGEDACTMTAKKLRLKGPQETLQFLVNASRKRWEYCCGDYCDDVTALLIQWNAPAKDSKDKCNHTCTIRPPEAAN